MYTQNADIDYMRRSVEARIKQGWKREHFILQPDTILETYEKFKETEGVERATEMTNEAIKVWHQVVREAFVGRR